MKKIILLLALLNINLFANYNVKILNKETIKSMKYSVDFEIPIVKGKFPTEEIIQEIAYNEKLKNPGYENYFISFYLPKMKINNGYFATAINTNDNNPYMTPKILYTILLFDEHYSKYLKEDENGNIYLEDIK